jgi:hypothetical protein
VNKYNIAQCSRGLKIEIRDEVRKFSKNRWLPDLRQGVVEIKLSNFDPHQKGFVGCTRAL